MLCTLVIPEGSGIDRVNEPVSFGLPFPCGVLSEPSRLSLIDQRSLATNTVTGRGAGPLG